jgi:hypothetical protein
VSTTEFQIPLFETDEPVARAEAREDRVQVVRYCRFPRVCADQRMRTAFTRDVSPSGLCVRVDTTEPVGALLRLVPRGVDGEPEPERIGRVAWTRATADGGRWLGIAMLPCEQREPIRIRYVRRPSLRRSSA